MQISVSRILMAEGNSIDFNNWIFFGSIFPRIGNQISDKKFKYLFLLQWQRSCAYKITWTKFELITLRFDVMLCGKVFQCITLIWLQCIKQCVSVCECTRGRLHCTHYENHESSVILIDCEFYHVYYITLMQK